MESIKINSVWKKVVLIFSIGFVLITNSVSREIEERQVEKMDSWQEEFDVNDKKGKQNVIVTVKDLGGNTTIGGPYNIFIDPKSDLPICQITNPVKLMRVPGNLNIVGTCIDDDAVDYVELIFDGDSENPVRAVGKDFWSYFLKTEGLEEGIHTIEVYGVDINGLKGDSVKVEWCLDRQKPVIEVTNIGSGTIVSGNVTISGVVSDGNGIKSMWYSLDNGEHFTDVKVSNNKKTNSSDFKFSINTKELQDGPAVIWFKAQDTMGSIGYFSFLCFVDNTNPALEIVFPADKEVQNGVFTAAGSVKDAIGIKSLTWEFNGESGEFEIIPGNCYWAKEFTFEKGAKGGKLVVTAVDTAGNITKKERNIIIDAELDKPLVNIQWPENAASLKEGDFYVRGIASDDDAVESVTISVDGVEVETIATKGVFACNFEKIENGKFTSFGKHTVTVVAKDKYGIVGNSVKVEYQSSGKKPVFSEASITGGKDAGYANFGKIVNPEGGSTFNIDASSLCGIKSASYSIEWSNDKFAVASNSKREEKQLELKGPSGKVSFAIPIETLPWGIVHLNFKVVDILDRETQYSTCLYVSNFSKVTEKPSDDLVEQIEDERATIKIVDIAGASYKRGMNVYVQSLIKSANARWNLGKDLSQKSEIPGINLEIESPLKDLQIAYKIYASAENRSKAVKEGKVVINKTDKNTSSGTAFIPLDGLNSAMTTIEIIATSGKDFSEKMYAQVAVVREIDSNYVNDYKMGQWISTFDTAYDKGSDSFVVGTCGKLSGFANLEGDVSASFVGQYPGLELLVDGKTISIVAMESGVYRNVTVRVTDSNGDRVDFAPVTIIVDHEGPAFDIQRPTLYEWVRNKLIIQGTATDKSGIASVEYSIDGGATWKSFGAAGRRTSVQLYAEENIQKFTDGIMSIDFRGIDISGNVSYYRSSVHKDTTPPTVKVVVPSAQDVVNGKNLIAFLVSDDGNFVKAEYVNTATGVRTPIDLASMITTFVGTKEQPINKTMRFDFTDAAGNVTTLNSWDFEVDNKLDLPIATVQLPTENEVITKDFVISGVVLDDDGPSTVYYKIDNGNYIQIPEPGYSFTVDVPLSTMLDNEHSVTVYAVDINGVRGPDFVRKFRVSLAEPVCQMTEPKIETTQSKLATLKGTAFDKNGIMKVEVSLDNGNSYNQVVGKENWSYTFDTRVIPDGTHVVFIKATDNYGIESIFSSLINIDNTRPEIELELPLDESRTTGPIFFSGYTIDNIGLTELYITVTSVDGRTVSRSLSKIDLVPDKIITKSVDISSLDNGNYNIRLTGKDAAGNETSVSRNIVLDKRVAEADVNIYYPLNGEHKNGEFNIYGEVITTRKVNNVSLILDGKVIETAELSNTGYFKFKMTPENLESGKHSYKVKASLEGNMSVDSMEQSVIYDTYGPWITIENFAYGDFAIERPFIKGKVGYSIPQEEIDAAKAKGATKEQKEALDAKTVSYLEVSFNNGRSFERLGDSKKDWKYRVENEDMPEGYHFMLVRAIMKNGQIAINRCIIQIDKTAPFVKMIAPSIGGRYNQTLEFSGLASDAVGLKSVTLALRKGDKAGYEVPGFIQGLYVDASLWGATLFNVGAGLTFFDNNVKLQFQWGQFTQAQREIFTQTTTRYGGNVFGFKLLANIAYIPFRSFLGPDWDWLSMGVAIGANFSFFTDTASGKPQMLSALLAQIEFPRATFKKAKCFRTIALYSEFQLWFIPTDIVSTDAKIQNTVFQFSEGIRVNIF